MTINRIHNKLKYNSMKTTIRAAFTLAMLAFGICAFAQSSKLYVEEFAIQKGETKTINIYLDNPDYTPTALQFDIYLSGGIKLVEEDGYANIFPVDDRVPGIRKGYSESGSWAKDNSYYRFLFYNSKGNAVTGTSGAILTMDVTTDDTFGTSDSPATITFKDTRLSDINNTTTSYKCAEALAKVYESKHVDDVVGGNTTDGKTCYIAELLKILALCRDGKGGMFAFATTGSQWIKLHFPNGNSHIKVGSTYAGGNIGGITSDMASNPTINISRDIDYEEANDILTETKNYADIEQTMTFKPNEVVSLTGFYFIDENGKPAISRWSGQNGPRGVILSLNTEWCDGANLSEQQYEFNQVVVQAKGTSSNAPRKIQNDRDTYSEYEFYLVEANSAIVTAIDDIDATSGVTSVKYYNIAGMESATPHSGMNIVVSTHADGSKTTTKQVF